MSAIIAAITYAGVPLLLVIGGFIIGKTVERLHIRSLVTREEAFKHIQVVNLKNVALGGPVRDVTYVDGQAVIGSDYFKTVASSIRGFFGGEIRSLRSIMDRARRESMLRMLERADEIGATLVCNVRIETSNIGRGQGSANAGLIMAEVHTYGTAICFDENPGQ